VNFVSIARPSSAPMPIARRRVTLGSVMAVTTASIVSPASIACGDSFEGKRRCRGSWDRAGEHRGDQRPGVLLPEQTPRERVHNPHVPDTTQEGYDLQAQESPPVECSVQKAL